MFGYIRPYVPSLRVGEYEYYRAAYCSVCREMGKVCGSTARFCLSYDAVFLSLVRGVITGDEPRPTTHHCPVNPLRRMKMLEGSSQFSYAGAVCAVLAAEKFADDKTDEKGFRRAAAGAGAGVSHAWIKHVKRTYPGLAEEIHCNLDAYYAAERAMESEGRNIDAWADAFGTVMAGIFAYGLAGEQKVIASSVGYHIGRWICCVDALDDAERDRKNGAPNPFLHFGTAEMRNGDDKNALLTLLSADPDAVSNALDLIENPGRSEARSIVTNVLREGLPRVGAAVVSGTYRKPRRDKLGSLEAPDIIPEKRKE